MHMKKLSIFAALMVVMAGVALASTLTVPFFFDNATSNTADETSIIGVKESSGNNQTVTVIYTAINTSGNPQNQSVTFFLPANQSVAFTPVSANHPIENVQSAAVPNMTIVGPVGATSNNKGGSALIIGANTLTGRFHARNFTRGSDMSHVLLPSAL